MQLWHYRHRRPWWHSFYRARLPICLALLCGASIGYIGTDSQYRLPEVHYSGKSVTHSAVRVAGCDIKGNINDRGERIYHVPGQAYYSATRINPARGERWFCSEWEAWWAGWRKAKV
ncbi:MAG: hypothetical protein EOS58_25480 [Mesorhizobium sp.]|nr:MAG: hypothetical protein EOS58_25480 [Mesorhizobium sp.]